ncbi:PEP-CTERM protein-sorting domain-containing protein [Terrimicrobium sacchariphilum]|uniref:PEP-CTERM protein-sorting domain-containing protein n=1 Tax=Terrimicrobium sacchariphilum TaxID=690879 RepID=A0A146GEC9_TERSA|nr:PEP-CTERM sorting domain-containing protein [Terrimicrobium sacchariphilum]GAT35473.1 PEP-CTERM protein-sorting domain-containing protein [Terrimicrobium sacchariphilum]
MKSLRLFLVIFAASVVLNGHGAMVLVDFSTLVSGPLNKTDTGTGYIWNSVAGANFSFSNLVDSGGTSTSLSLSSSTPDNYNAVGALVTGANSSPGPAWIGSNWISQDSLFTTTTVTLTLGGLSAGQVYNFEFFGARGNAANPVNNNRTALYTVTSGSSSGSANLNTSNNTNTTVNFNITADVTGNATITMALGTGNDSGFAYLNAMKVTAVPEPASVALVIIGGGLLLWVRLRKRSGVDAASVLR